MNELKTFNNPEFGQVRTLVIDGTPWFVGKDVAEILGYEKPTDAVRKRVDDEDRGISKMETPSGTQNMTIINESGLYSLILSSKLPKAREFKHWVTGTVLPSIRQNGGYIAGQENMTDVEVLANAVLVAQRVVTSLKDRCQFLGGQVVEQQKVIEELQPKASYYDLVLQCKDLIPTTVIAKDYGMSAQKFNEMLYRFGVQFCQSGVWVLYSKYQGCGYMKTKTHNYVDRNQVLHSREHSYWTQRGRLFLYEFLKQREILPLMEAKKAV